MKKKDRNWTDLYTPLHPLKDLEDFRSDDDREVIGDRRDGKLYRYTKQIKLCVNIALATGRPLLVLGTSGCGKSSLAFNLARALKRRYYEFVVTSRSQAKDLFYRFDAVRRLANAYTGREPQAAKPDNESIWSTQYPYIEPGPLWWIFHRESAKRRGYSDAGEVGFPLAVDPVRWPPQVSEETSTVLLSDEADKVSERASAVLLIDEIDKAEPDFPNNLLVPLGSHQFMLEEIAKVIKLRDTGHDHSVENTPLVIITSNRERELPEAFIRRCVVLEIADPSIDELVEIATAVTGKQQNSFFREIAEKIVGLNGGRGLSIAEFLDAIHAIEKLNAKEQLLAEILRSTTWRSRES